MAGVDNETMQYVRSEVAGGLSACRDRGLSCLPIIDVFDCRLSFGIEFGSAGPPAWQCRA